jgi:hypothetical protein
VNSPICKVTVLIAGCVTCRTSHDRGLFWRNRRSDAHLQRHVIATAAHSAVEEVGPAAHAADAAFVAVELLFGIIVVEKSTYQARICRKAYATLLAVAPNWLTLAALGALKLLYRMPLQNVPACTLHAVGCHCQQLHLP